ncbi:MAG: hypothetical protein AB7I19_06350 [Planctomycetota bacterium]
MTSLSALRALSLTGGLLASMSLASAQCFEQNFGSLLGTGDDTVFAIQPIGFAFPLGGTTYTDVHVSTNGFFYLSNAGTPAPGSSGCCTGSSSTMLAGSPRIAPWWHDLNVIAPGGVYLNSSATRTVITWHRVVEFGNSTQLTFQVQIFPDGDVVMYFDNAVLVRTSGNCLTGLSAGGGAADPGVADLSAGSVGGTLPSAYELFNTSPQIFDLANLAVTFDANGLGGYDISGAPCIPGSSATYGVGCPGPWAGYEQFTSGIDLNGGAIHFFPNGAGGYQITACNACFYNNFGADLALGDDDLAVGLNLGFSFPYAGTNTTAIDACSNGFVWLQTGVSTGTDFSESVIELLSEADRIAVSWDDYNPGAAGSVHFNALPGVAVVTWNGVTEFNAGNSNTFQLQLYPDGSFVIAHQNVVNLDALVGWAAGAPGAGSALDLSANPQDTGAVGAPMTHGALNNSRPILGQLFNVVFDGIPAGVTDVAWLLGFTQTNLPLGSFGAPGCSLLHSNDLAWVGTTATTGPVAGSLGLGNDPVLLGLSIQSQGLALVPGINALGLVVSNGLTINIGGF